MGRRGTRTSRTAPGGPGRRTVTAWVEQTGSSAWRVRYRDDSGHLHSISGFRSEREAADHAAGLDEQRHRGNRIDPADGRTTVDEWTRGWLPTLTVSERTEENYRRDLTNHVLSRWGESTLASITGADVQRWAGQLHAAGYAPTTVATLIKLLSRVLGDAVDARLIAENPARQRPHRGPAGPATCRGTRLGHTGAGRAGG